MNYYQNVSSIKVESEEFGYIIIPKEGVSNHDEYVESRLKEAILEKYYNTKMRDSIVDQINKIRNLDRVYKEIEL